MVLANNEWVQLRYKNILESTVEVRIEDFAGTTNPVFAEIMFNGVKRQTFIAGRDYEIDAVNGRIRRTVSSSIPNFANSVFYGKEEFNHEEYHGRWGNFPFMLHISYIYEAVGNQLIEDEARRITATLQTPRIEKSVQRLLSGEELTYLVFGDSISVGCEALYLSETYFARFVDLLQKTTNGTVKLCNESIGGQTSREGMARFKGVLEKHKPQLVSIAYGMNDMCRGGTKKDVTVKEYTDNMHIMIEMARNYGVEVIVITNCLPNPHWKFTGKDYKDYAKALRRLAKEENISLADVQELWESELKHGKRLSDLLFNDINHPTSYGHYLYYAMLETLL